MTGEFHLIVNLLTFKDTKKYLIGNLTQSVNQLLHTHPISGTLALFLILLPSSMMNFLLDHFFISL
jgi:hypothetical protein